MGANASRLTSIASVATGPESHRVFWQDKSNQIIEAIFADGAWVHGDNETSLVAANTQPGTGIAAVAYNDGKNDQIRLYYVGADGVLAESCWSADVGEKWYVAGTLHSLNVVPKPKSALAATWWGDRKRLDLWYIDASNTIRRVYTGPSSWAIDNNPYDTAVDGSPLLVTTNICASPVSRCTLLWYQEASDGVLMIYVLSESGAQAEVSTTVTKISTLAIPTKLSPTGITRGTPITGIVWNPTVSSLDGHINTMDMQLFWQDPSGAIREARLHRWWSNDTQVRAPVVEYVARGDTTGAGVIGVYPTNLSAIVMPDGKKMRLFYQGVYDRVCEMRNDGAGWLDLGPIISI